MQKINVWRLCSIFNNNSHVFQQIKNPHTSSMQGIPRNIHTKFGSDQSSSFREELWIIVNEDNGCRTPSDGNSSHGLWQGELIITNPNLFIILDSFSTVCFYYHRKIGGKKTEFVEFSKFFQNQVINVWKFSESLQFIYKRNGA